MRLRALSLSFLIPTVACAAGPRYKPPEMAVPKAWQESRASGVAAGDLSLERWWTAFHDPIVDRLVGRALEGNLDLKIAGARIREARAARGIAASAALPQVGVGGAYSRSQRSDAVPPFKSASGESSPFGPREQNAFEAGFDASWEIDVFGGVRRDEEAALAQAQAAEEDRRDVLVTLLADVARNYVELRAAQRRLEILEQTLRSERDTLDLARARLEGGLGTELDVARAEGLLAANTAQRPALERVAREAVYRLGVLLGKDPGALASELEAPGDIPTAPPEIPLALPSDLLSRRPDLRRAERELAAATARIGVAKADLFPRFSIIGGFGRRSEDASDLSSGSSAFRIFIAGVRWPLFSGGRIRANIRVQNARQEQALLRYEKSLLAALEEVENALSAHARELRREQSLRAAVTANQRALELATDRYTSGLEDFLSVLDAQRSVYAAQAQLVQSERNAVVDLISVYKSLGGGWSFDQTSAGSDEGNSGAQATTPTPSRVGAMKEQENMRLGSLRLTPWIMAAAMATTIEVPNSGGEAKIPLGTLRVAIDGFRNTKGRARVAVFDRGQGFPDDESAALRKTVVEIGGGRAQVQFEGLPLGDYAVSMYHDENEDGKLNKKLFGIPKEGYGVSNNVVHAMRAPKFAEALFRFHDESQELSIHVHY